jgi:hypothetical protein
MGRKTFTILSIEKAEIYCLCVNNSSIMFCVLRLLCLDCECPMLGWIGLRLMVSVMGLVVKAMGWFHRMNPFPWLNKTEVFSAVCIPMSYFNLISSLVHYTQHDSAFRDI